MTLTLERPENHNPAVSPWEDTQGWLGLMVSVVVVASIMVVSILPRCSRGH